MSVSFMWEVVTPSKPNVFDSGTSSDIEALKEAIGDHACADQIPLLRAMHLATGRNHSLWKAIADTLEKLSQTDPEVTIRIWPQF